MKFQHLISSLLMAVFITGCNNGPKGVRFVHSTGGSSSSELRKASRQPIRMLTQNEMRSALIGKNFQYTRADSNGFVTYNANGTTSFTDDLKGSGRGTWKIVSGQFCETFNHKRAQECGSFKATGDAYFAANTRLVEIKE